MDVHRDVLQVAVHGCVWLCTHRVCGFRLFEGILDAPAGLEFTIQVQCAV